MSGPRDFQARKDRWFRAVIGHPDLRSGAAAVLWFIADAASVRESGHSWFSHATIAAGTAMSVTAVQRALRSAEQCGLLLIESYKEQRRPARCWPILDGEPLAGTLPQPLNHRSKVTDAVSPTSVESDRCDDAATSVTSASDIGRKCLEHRAKVTDNLSNDLSKDLSNHFDQQPSKRKQTAPRKKRPLTEMPAIWPTADGLEWAKGHWTEMGRPDLVANAQAEAAKARDDRLSKDIRYANWDAGWRIWARNAVKFNAPPAAAPQRGTPGEARDQILRDLHTGSVR